MNISFLKIKEVQKEKEARKDGKCALIRNRKNIILDGEQIHNNR
jgi:hypothetical protein